VDDDARGGVAERVKLFLRAREKCDPEVVQTVGRLVDWAGIIGLGHHVTAPEGDAEYPYEARVIGLHPMIQPAVFGISPNSGTVIVKLGELKPYNPFKIEGKRVELRERLRRLSEDLDQRRDYPTVRAERLTDPAAWDSLTGTLLWMKDRIRGANPRGFS
jgi:hypothetical protein